MPLPPSFLPPLRRIYQHLQGADIRWAITGSVSMVLQGMALEPNDIDLQADSDGAYVIQDALLEYITQPIYWRESAQVRSHFGALEIDGVKVEVMGDVEKRLPNGLWTPPPDLTTVITHVTYADMRLPVIDLQYEYEAYRLMGREAKAQAIYAFLQQVKK